MSAQELEQELAQQFSTHKELRAKMEAARGKRQNALEAAENYASTANQVCMGCERLLDECRPIFSPPGHICCTPKL